MRCVSMWLIAFVAILCSLTMSGCSTDGNNETLVTIRGRVDDGTATSAIAHAECRFVNRDGGLLSTALADGSGEFLLGVPPEVEGFIGCNPPGFSRLILATFISTVGIAAREIIPQQGREVLSPLTTLVANIIAQTMPPDPQARKLELLAALEAQDPDLTMLAGAVTALFNALFERQIDDVEFSGIGGEGDGVDGGSGSGGGDNGGVGGVAGDGGEFSPFVNALVEFSRDLRGDTAFADLLMDGNLDRLPSIELQVQQSGAIREAFARLFPHGIQPLVNGQPLRTRTNANGAYFLPVPSNTPGFITCTPAPNLAISAFVQGRQPEERLTHLDISPPMQIFTTLIFPQLPPQEVEATAHNFRTDIGNLGKPVDGIVRMEFEETPQGDRLITDLDGDGIVCSLLESPAEAAIRFAAAGAASFAATALYTALRIEVRNPAAASYADIIAALLVRTDAAGEPRVEAEAEDLVAAGVPGERATGLVPGWNDCVQTGIIERFQTSELPARMVREGRLRVTVREANGNPVPNARVEVTGAFITSDGGGSGCPTQSDALELEDNRMLCSTSEAGRVTFVLLGNRSLIAIPVTLAAESADGTLRGQLETAYLAPTTRDQVITVTSP